ncbi:ankyrin and armadillo repeat-containing [Pelobates cultripes]|uniref:Ankyrin and armadillo repeat-containing n=1 Tax=Pelobates cultripes TaxID=61616 RepID=A0AAD1WDD5_PELCU|nr:ankyrin and armadillo repeat-containing [Pelobates cultripes]
MAAAMRTCAEPQGPQDRTVPGLIDITSESEFDGIYSQTSNFDPTYDPSNMDEKLLFMDYADSMTIKMTCFTVQVQRLKNLFVYEGSYLLSNVIKLTEEFLDPVVYQRLQQRLSEHQKLVKGNLEKKLEIRKNIAYLKLISFLVPFLLGLKKQLKVPDLSCLLQPFSDDKVKTERELPPLMLGQDFKCQHFRYPPNTFFHLHGGIELDLGTPSLEPVSEEIKGLAAYEEIENTAVSHLNNLLDLDTTYIEYYPIPTMAFNGLSYYAIAIKLENFYQTTLRNKWWGAIGGIISNLKPKRLPLTDIQLHEQFKKKFGYRKAIKCKNLSFGLKSAAERGLAAIFHTFCRKTPNSRLNVIDEVGYALIHHAAIHNRVSVVSQIAKIGLNLNQRRSDHFTSQGRTGLGAVAERTGPTALHLAARCGSLEVLSCLLALKADYLIHDKRGWLPIHFAAFYGTIPCIRALCRKDPALLEIETVSKYHSTPLLLTAISGSLDTLQYLFSIGANWKKIDSMENNIIHLAVLYFHTHILKYIIELNIQELHVWQHLVDMLKSENSHRIEMAARCLEVLCVVKRSYWEDIYKAGCVQCLVDLLKSGRLNLECLASGVLSNISNNIPVSKTLVESGAIPVLITLLSSHQPELQSRCSVILSDIAQVDSNQNVIAEMGGIPPLVHLLYGELEDVLVNSINCVRVLCVQNPTNQRAVKDLGGIPLLVELLGVKSDILVSASSAAIAELARGNKLIQDVIAKENAIDPLINIIRGRKLNIQVKAAMAMEALADHNAAIQKEFLDRAVSKHISKLLKVFQLDVREQGSITLWALAGQTRKQRKNMAEQIGYNFIIDMLLSPSNKMQYVEAVIALCKDSKHHQDQICDGNGIGPLVRLLRNSKVAEGTLLSIIKALGTMCIGVAHINNPVTQDKIVEEQALPTLIHLLKTHGSIKIKVEVACTLACIVLKNAVLQAQLHEMEEFKYTDVLDLLHTPDKDICLRVGYALALFAYNSTLHQFYILETGGIEMAIYEPFLESDIETDRAQAAFQVVVLARVIVDMDQVSLSARGVTILTELLNSNNSATLILAGELIASLAHTRAGIPEAITTLGTVESLCKLLNSEEEEVRISSANALGYLTFNRTAYRHLLVECRNKPNLYNVLIGNLSKDAKISYQFTEEFTMQQHIGLPSLSLVINGGPPVNPSSWKGLPEHPKRAKSHVHWREDSRSRSAIFSSSQKPHTANAHNRTVTSLPTSRIPAATRPKTAHLGNTKPFQTKKIPSKIA